MTHTHTHTKIRIALWRSSDESYDSHKKNKFYFCETLPMKLPMLWYELPNPNTVSTVSSWGWTVGSPLLASSRRRLVGWLSVDAYIWLLLLLLHMKCNISVVCQEILLRTQLSSLKQLLTCQQRSFLCRIYDHFFYLSVTTGWFDIWKIFMFFFLSLSLHYAKSGIFPGRKIVLFVHTKSLKSSLHNILL